MRVAKTIASFVTAMAVALALVLQVAPTPAVAVVGYDSAFLFESDWLIVKQGDTGQAAVTFLNVGSVTWQKGGTSQVNLAACCPLNSPPTHASWAQGWLSSTAYATQREDLVAPGGRATYIWNFTVPATATPGIYDFPGDLVLASTGEAIHREGYFHRNDLRAPAAAGIVVTPTDAATNQVSTPTGTNANRGARSYTATVTGAASGTCVDIALIPSADFDSATGKFDDKGPDDKAATADDNNLADNLGETNGVIEVVQGVATAGTDDFVDCVTVPADGKISFSIDGRDGTAGTTNAIGKTVRPVVWIDADNDNALDLDAATADANGFKSAKETNGVGGSKAWIAPAAASQVDTLGNNGCVVRVDKTNRSFSLDFALSGTGGASGANTIASNCTSPKGSDADNTFFYDSGDAFFVEGIPATMADFEAALSRADIVDVRTYSSDPAPQSSFNLQGDTPTITSCAAEKVSATNTDDIRITITPDAPNLASGLHSKFVIQRAPVTAGGTDEVDNGTIGTYSTVAEPTTDEDTGTTTTFEFTDKDVPAGVYRYRCSGVVDGDEGPRKPDTTNESSVTPGVGAGIAPTSQDLRVTTNTGLTGQLDPGDTFKIGFSEVMDTSSTGDQIKLRDADGTVMTVVCTDAGPAAGQFTAACQFNTATESLGGVSYEAGRVVTVTLKAQSLPTLASETGTTSGMQLPADVTDQGGFTDPEGNQWNVAGSADKTIDVE